MPDYPQQQNLPNPGNSFQSNVSGITNTQTVVTVLQNMVVAVNGVTNAFTTLFKALATPPANTGE